MEKSSFWGTNKQNPLTGTLGIKQNKRKGFLKSLGVSGIILIVISAILGLALYLVVISPAFLLVSSVSKVQNNFQQVLVALTNRDLVQLERDLSTLEINLNNLRTERDKKFSWAKGFTLFKVNEFYSDSDKFINAGLYAIEAIREMSVVITPFADAAGLKVDSNQQLNQQEIMQDDNLGQVKEQDLSNTTEQEQTLAQNEDQGLMEAFQNWVSLMPAVANQMDGVIEKLSKVGNELQDINVEKYPNEYNGIAVRDSIKFVKDLLSDADTYAPDIKNALILFPKLLGVETPEKRYMILMQNDKEIRPTGGFMTNYATFKIDDGLLQSDFTSKDMYSIDYTLDIIDATYDFPDPPKAYSRHLKVERWYARDMNYSPDFVTSMDQFLKFYNMAGTIAPNEIKPVDGIFAIDTTVIKELLEVTGPVTVNGITYTEDNVVLELEKIASLQLQEQVNRKRVLGDLMEAMLVNVFESEKNLWTKMIDKGIDLALRRHIQVYIFDADAQSLIEKYGLGGRIKDNSKIQGDYSMVVSTNLGGDKTNWFVKKDVSHSATKENDKWLRTVKIKYTYQEPTGEYALFAKRFRDWVRVYAPEGSKFINVSGSLEESSSDTERGKVWYSGYIELGPNEQGEITFSYYLPDNLNFIDNYDLFIQKQGGVPTEKYTINVNEKTESIELKTDKNIKIKL